MVQLMVEAIFGFRINPIDSINNMENPKITMFWVAKEVKSGAHCQILERFLSYFSKVMNDRNQYSLGKET